MNEILKSGELNKYSVIPKTWIAPYSCVHPMQLSNNI